jgi:hypothetical protein
MMSKQYWVIGGEYRDAEFHEIEEGSHRVYGPFSTYEQANITWKQRSEKSRAQAYTRYTIVASAHNPVRPALRAAMGLPAR